MWVGLKVGIFTVTASQGGSVKCKHSVSENLPVGTPGCPGEAAGLGTVSSVRNLAVRAPLAVAVLPVVGLGDSWVRGHARV